MKATALAQPRDGGGLARGVVKFQILFEGRVGRIGVIQVWGEEEESTTLRFLACAERGGCAQNCVRKAQRGCGSDQRPHGLAEHVGYTSLAFGGWIWARDTNVGESLPSSWHRE